MSYWLQYPFEKILVPAGVSVSLTIILFWRLYRKQPKNVLFWIIIALNCAVIAVTAVFFRLNPYGRLLLFYLLLLEDLAIWVLLILAICQNKKVQSSVKIVYICVIVLAAAIIPNAFANILADTPRVITGNFCITEYRIDTDFSADPNYLVPIDLKEGSTIFHVSQEDFTGFEKGAVYQMEYLPNCNYVVNILDENGKSMLRR